MQKTNILPQHDPASGWAAILPPRPPAPALQGQQRFDWLVVGAGYAGLMVCGYACALGSVCGVA